jgi:hypothetical protein
MENMFYFIFQLKTFNVHQIFNDFVPFLTKKINNGIPNESIESWWIVYGCICPIETSKGMNVRLIASLAIHAKVISSMKEIGIIIYLCIYG